MTDTMPDLAGLTSGQYSAHNYAPLPVVVSSAAGVWVTDVAGRRYLDLLAGVFGAEASGTGTRGSWMRRCGSSSG